MMDRTLQAAYGSYPVPTAIRRLLQLEAQLVQAGLTLALIGFRPLSTYEPDWIAPPDFIPFAETGGDGIVFGFLTDFGQASSLESAPIVCVTPTNDPPIRLMARNISEFFDLVASVPFAEFLEEWWTGKDESAVKAESEAFMKSAPPDVRQNRSEVAERFKSTFATNERNVLTYIKAVRAERESQLAIQTLDGLGVIGAQRGLRRYAFVPGGQADEAEVVRMQAFLASAVREEQLAFIRDAIYRDIAASGDEQCAELLYELFGSLGLTDERARIY